MTPRTLSLDAPVFVAGRFGSISAALVRVLEAAGHRRVIGARAGPDLSNDDATDQFFSRERPQYVFLVGGRSGGILANQRFPADLAYDNLRVIPNVIASAHRHGVERLLYVCSSCVYPKHAPQPMAVESLMSGALEPTSRAYAMARLMGLMLCDAYRAQYGMPCVTGIAADVFGPDDHFTDDAHVVPALVRKMIDAVARNERVVDIWGSGRAQREFMFADDLADACLFVMTNYDGAEPINLGGGAVTTIAELAEHVRAVTGFKGELRFDHGRPDGMPFKALDSRRLAEMGWRPRTAFRDGLEKMADAYRSRASEAGDGVGMRMRGVS